MMPPDAPIVEPPDPTPPAMPAGPRDAPPPKPRPTPPADDVIAFPTSALTLDRARERLEAAEDEFMRLAELAGDARKAMETAEKEVKRLEKRAKPRAGRK